MVNNMWFKHMKKNSFFINTSRGEVVDENALISAIKTKKISGAAVDVVTNEQEIIKKSNRLIQFSKNK